MADNLKSLEAMHAVVENFRTIKKVDREFLLRKLTEEHELLGEKNDKPFAEVEAYYLNGGKRDKIPAIKMVRDKAKELGILDQYGLKAAKDLVESW